MADRPTGVSVIGWLSVIGSVAGIVMSTWLATVSDTWDQLMMTGPFYEWLGSLSTAGFFAFYWPIAGACAWAGWAMLKGRSWSRHFLIIACVLGMIVHATLDLDVMGIALLVIFDMAFITVLANYLYRGAASDFFATD